MRTRWLQGAVVLLLSLVAIEAASYLTGRLLIRNGTFYAPPAVPEGRPLRYGDYLEKRHPLLGWPYPIQLETRRDRFDAEGARPSPDFPAERHETRVSLYGDSFTQSPQDPGETWGDELARRLGRRVANYGMSSYGSDQAFLRYRDHADDPAAVVVLAHYTGDLLRNLTRLRDLQNQAGWYGFKPRFVLGPDGALRLLPLPTLSESEYRRLGGSEGPPLALEGEPFAPGGAAGAVLLAPPYSLAVLRDLGYYRLRAALARRPAHAEFYRPDHPLGGVPLTVAILREFARTAERRGQVPLVLILPGEGDLDVFRRTGRWIHEPLVRGAADAGVDVADFGPTLARLAEERGPSQLFHMNGHYTAEVDRALAAFVFASLERRDLLGRIRAGGVSRTSRGAPPGPPR